MSGIRVLDEQLINQIAAGEGERTRLRSTASRVLERPERGARRAGPRAGQGEAGR